MVPVLDAQTSSIALSILTRVELKVVNLTEIEKLLMSSFATCARGSTLRQTDVQRRNGLAHLSGPLPKLYKMKSQASDWTTIAVKSSMNDQQNGMMVRTLPCYSRNFLELSPAFMHHSSSPRP